MGQEMTGADSRQDDGGPPPEGRDVLRDLGPRHRVGGQRRAGVSCKLTDKQVWVRVPGTHVTGN